MKFKDFNLLTEDKFGDFSEQQVNQIERLTNKCLVSPVFIDSIYSVDNMYKAFFSTDTNPKKRGTITFSCRSPNYKKIEDFKVHDITGMIRVKNQDVFESEIKLVENPAADARFEVLKASLTEHEEEMLKLLEDLMEKVKEGKFDEVIHDSRDLVNLAHKANDILDKLPKIK